MSTRGEDLFALPPALWYNGGKVGCVLIYAVRYGQRLSSRREEAALQRQLARGLLRLALRREYGLELDALPMDRGPHGKPYFVGAPVHFSLSHCPGLVCCCLHTGEVGVDAEGPRPFSQRLARRICTKEEAAWLATSPNPARDLIALWTLKESVMKLEGRGIAMGFQNAAFTFPEGKPRSADPQVVLSQFFLEGGFVVSAAARSHAFSQLCFVDPSELSLS